MASAGQWFIAAIFAAAAAFKLQDRNGFLRALVSIPGLGIGAARRLTILVPTAELGVAGCALASRTAGALAALAALSAFTAVVLRELLAGRRFECGCFGGTTHRHAGPETLVRNGVLGAVAVVTIITHPAATPFPAAMTGVGAAIALVLIETTTDALAAREGS